MKDVKFVASDMDKTLLESNSKLPAGIDDIINNLMKLDINFGIASGRPIYTLQDLFPELKNEMTFICDNGGLVSYKGKILFKSLIDVPDYQRMVHFVEDDTDGVPIICALDAAYVNKKYEKYVPFLKTFYTKVELVDDLRTIQRDANKFTIYFPNGHSQKYYDDIFEPEFGDNFSVVVSGEVWIDIMNKGIDKGGAIRLIGNYLDIDPSKMMAFGDTFNDKEMLQAVKYSYLMANGSEGMEQYANYRTGTNDEHGVLQVLNKLIEEVSDN
ncbi:Cof-type HAD-IIB family hydrolase [Companilactobacillus allii]|uniref:Haloacid dehalogenase n=1 Tax=Companilactobacillus allii TaxID=1847728 RepID=A0A1P8Q527_9LACO|nr:Cof-type HAD-IIB family hydrolase [Companilactobacillus allii]APX72957.1 haloacid dehalogenase [Companilactobacillus allii]USQ67749.1 Cof-type HAD-IIB family hydrolase [Companilactobacillus allii]